MVVSRGSSIQSRTTRSQKAVSCAMLQLMQVGPSYLLGPPTLSPVTSQVLPISQMRERRERDATHITCRRLQSLLGCELSLRPKRSLTIWPPGWSLLAPSLPDQSDTSGFQSQKGQASQGTWVVTGLGERGEVSLASGG